MLQIIEQLFILLLYFATALRNDRIIKHHKAKSQSNGVNVSAAPPVNLSPYTPMVIKCITILDKFENLDQISGENVSEDLLNKLFSLCKIQKTERQQNE